MPYQAQMEAAFGQDFSNVRAFTGRGAQMKAMGAEAAAIGDTLTFASENPSPALVAHELAHVVQARSARGRPCRGVGDASARSEREAEALGPRAARGERVAPVAEPAGQVQLDRTPKARTDVRPVPGDVRAKSGVTVNLPDTVLEHVLHSHTPEHFDPAKRLQDLNSQGITDPNHKTSFFRTGSITNSRELFTLIRQALQGKAGRGVSSTGRSVLNLKLRGRNTRAAIGPQAGGGLKLLSIFPTSGNGLKRSEIVKYQQDIAAGTKDISQVRAEVAQKVG